MKLFVVVDMHDGHVPLIIVQPDDTAGTRIATNVRHHRLLATLEEQWGLGRLGHANEPGVALIDTLLVPAS